MEKKIAMCQWFSQKIEDDKEFLNDVWFSDKAHFLMHVNSKNWVFGEAGTLTEGSYH
jgi:hypothetical protein